MKQLKFLIIGKDQVILDTLKRIIEKNEGWKAILVNDENLAYDAVRSHQPDIVLLSSGLQDTFERDIKAFCHEPDQNIKVIEHYGGGSGLLLSEVEACFSEPQETGHRVLHKADSREKTALDWLSGGKTFSFGDFYDPERIYFGALRVLNDDIVKSGKGFGTHPHDNMEIISIVLEGTLIHEDNLGNKTEIQPGDIQVMSAGTGVMHSEFSKDEGGFGKFLQIWVYPKQRNVTPRYDQITLDPAKSHNSFQQILSPDPEDAGVWIYQDAWFHLGHFDDAVETRYQIMKKGNGVYAFIIEGNAEIDGQKLERRDGFGIYGMDEIHIKATSGNTEILLMEVPMA